MFAESLPLSVATLRNVATERCKGVRRSVMHLNVKVGRPGQRDARGGLKLTGQIRPRWN